MRSVKLIILFLLSSIIALAQGPDDYVQPMGYKQYSFPYNVNIGVGLPARKTHAAAYLEIGPSTGATKGALMPRLSTTERNAIASPPAGLLVYNKTTNTYQYYNGIAWIEFGTGGSTDTTSLSNRINQKINISDSAAMLAPYYRTAVATAALLLKLNISDTVNMRVRLNPGTNITITGTYPNLTVNASGGASPDGNNTALQFKRNGAFTGSDSAQWTSTGFDYKGRLIQRNSAGTEQMRIFSDNQVNTFIGYGSGLVNNFAGGGTDNTGVGYETLISNTTGTLNTAIGKRALITVSTGSNNSAVGAGSFQKTTGSNNVGLGYHSGFENTSGGKNTAIGTIALINQTTGSENTAVGYQASGNATGAYDLITAIGAYSLIQSTGNYNTGVGANTLYSTTTGANNTALGYAAGYGNTGSSNVFIGYQTGLSAHSASNRLMIHNSNSATPLLYGEFDNGLVKVNGKLFVTNRLIKTIADSASYVPAWIDPATGEIVQAAFHYQGSTGGTPGGSNTQFQYNNSGAFGGTTLGYNNSTGAVTLTGSSNTSQFTIKANSTQSNSNPLFRLQNSAGTDLLWMHSDNAVNTFVGVSSGIANNFAGGGTDNTGYGYETLSSNTTGSLNTAVGKRAMIMNVTGAGNSAVGAGALQKTTGSNNVALGYHAGLENTSGGKNTAIGTNALQNKTTGDENTIVGYQASGNATGSYSYVTAVGTQSLIQSTGNANTGIGYQTLYGNLTGTNNTALGYGAGYNNTGSSNVFLGYLAGMNETGSNKLYISNSNTSDPLVLGDFSAGTLNLNARPSVRNLYSIGGSLKVNTTDVGNVGTGVDDLISYAVPAGTLSTNGDYLEYEFVITFASNTNNKTVRIVFGATEIYNSTAQPQNTGTMIISGKIVRTGATTQDVTAKVSTDGALFTNIGTYTTAAETLSGAVTLKATGEATSNDDIVCKILTLKYYPNN